MSVYIVQNTSLRFIVKSDLFKKIGLHKSPDIEEQMKERCKQLKVGETIKFPNGLEVTLATKEVVVSLSGFRDVRNKLLGHTLRTLQEKKDRTYDTKHTNI